MSRVSLSEVAKAAGVSVTTVSRVLNGAKNSHRVGKACADRVRATAERLGYEVNYHGRAMRLGRAETIGVAIDIGDVDPTGEVHDDARPLAQPYFAGMVGGIEYHTRMVNYRMMAIGPDSQMRAPDRGLVELKQRRLDGLIVFGSVVRVEFTQFLSQEPREPIVVLECHFPTRLPVVELHHQKGINLAVDHLVQLGHRRILYLGVEEGVTSVSPMIRPPRQQLFVDAMRRHGLTPLLCPVQGRAATFQPDRAAREAEAAFEKHLARGKPDFTAIVCYNDETAIGAHRALLKVGLSVPRDISLVGFDDVYAINSTPRLTTVSHQFEQLGQRAAQLVLELFNTPSAIEQYAGTRELIDPVLIERESTARLSR